MSLSSGFNSLAIRMLTKFGQSCVLNTSTQGNFDPETGILEDVDTDQATGIGYPSSFKLDQIDGTTIKKDDLMVLLAISQRPTIEDTLTLGDKTYTIVGLQVVTVNTDDVVYKVQVRQ